MEPLIFVVYIVVFLYSVVLHEIAHGFVAYRFGDDTAKVAGRLTFNPLVHIDWLGSLLLPALLFLSTGFAFGYAKPVPVNPYRLHGGSASYRLVALAGILTNLVLAIVAAVVLKGSVEYFHLGLNNLGVIFFELAFILNVVLAVFNAIPFPGFDGFNFLSTFDWFAGIVKQTPIGNPLFMARYGLWVSLLILVFAWQYISTLLLWVLGLASGLFGISGIIGI